MFVFLLAQILNYLLIHSNYEFQKRDPKDYQKRQGYHLKRNILNNLFVDLESFSEI